MARLKNPNSPWLYDDVSGDIVGVRDPDGSDRFWVMGSNQPTVYKATPMLPIVAPASTFITLTNSDDGGQTKLTGAGVHGLTNANSAGKSVYVTWTGGTAVSGFYEVVECEDATDELTIDIAYDAGLGTAVVSKVNTDIVLASQVIPAGAAVPGMGIEWDALVSCTGSTNNKTVKANWGSGAWYSQTFAGNNQSLCVEKKACILSSGDFLSNALATPGHGLSTGAVVQFTPSGGITAAQTFEVIGSLSTADEFIEIDAWSLRINGL